MSDDDAKVSVTIKSLMALADERDARAAEVAKLRRVICFFASVIKSGEPWTETCQREFNAVMPTEVQ